MDKEQIKQGFKDKGCTFASVAKFHEISPSMVGAVASRTSKSRPVAESICKVLGKTMAEVFPDVASYQAPAIKNDSHWQQLLAS